MKYYFDNIFRGTVRNVNRLLLDRKIVEIQFHSLFFDISLVMECQTSVIRAVSMDDFCGFVL